MGRYLHLYFTFMKKSLISKLEYKKDTFVAMMGFLFENAAAVASIYLIVSSIPSLNGWTFDKIGFLYGFCMLPRGLDHLLTDNLWLVAYRSVRSGEMDGYYLKPLPILFQVVSETFQVDAFGELIVGTVMMVTCGIIANVQMSFSLVFLLIVATIFGAVIITSLKIILASLAFKFKTSGQILQIIYNFMDYVKYPISIFPAVIRNFLIFIVPFGLCISMPIGVVFGSEAINPYLLSLWIFGTAVVFLPISIFIWTRLEGKYESTGN